MQIEKRRHMEIETTEEKYNNNIKYQIKINANIKKKTYRNRIK